MVLQCFFFFYVYDFGLRFTQVSKSRKVFLVNWILIVFLVVFFRNLFSFKNSKG